MALALIPEAIAFSVIAGVDPRVGLFAAFTMAVTTSVLGGRPAMVSAATGAVALVIAPLMASHGLDHLIAAVILAGILQIVLGLVGAAKLMRFVPRSVTVGFVNALAILIFTSQVPELIGVPWAVHPLTVLGLAIVFLLPKLTTVVPAPLVAIIVITAIVVPTGMAVPSLGDKGELPDALPSLFLPNVPFTLETFRVISPYALTMAPVVVTVWTHDLALGVVIGVLVAMVAFARRVAHLVSVDRTIEDRDGQETAVYTVHGELFFASSNDLYTMFDYAGDPRQIVLDFADSHLWDASTVAALDSVTDKHAHYGKDARIVGLDQASRRMRVRMSGTLNQGGH